MKHTNTNPIPHSIRKRDGEVVAFDNNKIYNAMRKANDATPQERISSDALSILTSWIVSCIPKDVIPTVEQVQDIVEEALINAGYAKTAKAYILYRAEHSKIRKSESDLMEIYRELTYAYAKDADIKRENANIDADTAMGTMLKYGSEGAKYFVDNYVLPKDIASAHINGDIHIHDKDFYMLTETCCQIDIKKLYQGGFSTGHGHIREPRGIQSYAALACIAIQANQNEMHGGQSIPAFDYAMAEGVALTYSKEYYRALCQCLMSELLLSYDDANNIIDCVSNSNPRMTITQNDAATTAIKASLEATISKKNIYIPLDFEKVHKISVQLATAAAERETYQAMQAFIHNLNTMNSRAGAQVPFSSINYGTDISPEGRMVIKNLLLATYNGLGDGETPIFPVQIFKVKEGVNYNPDDPNYDLFKLAIKVSAKRLFPNFSFLDAPFNLQYYREGNYDTEVAYMGCRTRVIGNVYDNQREVTSGRGNLSFTSINLPRIALDAAGDLSRFYTLLDEKIELVVRQLLHRLNIQSVRKCRNYPFLMGQGVWLDSDSLSPDDTVEEVLKHGTLSMGFIGLAETLVALTGKHHGESSDSQALGIEIVTHMRKRMDECSAQHRLNFTLLATPAEGLSGRFVAIDRATYGSVPGVTDREYYTNSFHVPVYFSLPAFKKISLESPYHALTNAGHISYVELDGDVSKNLLAFESIVRYMKECGIGYGSVNHPVDRDPICGYTGVIDEVCPKCGRHELLDDGNEVKFERIRRITGYLVGTTDRFNNAKRAEERDRVKHSI